MVAINPQEPITTASPENKIRLRWTHIVLPAVFLVLSLVMMAAFYAKLPAQVAYHFNGDAPDRWLSRGAFLGWMIAPQLLFTLLSFLLVRVILLGVRYWPADSTPLHGLLPVMGNIMALPQIILFIAMVQFFLYNTYHHQPFPLWIIAVIVMVLGAIILVVFFTKAIRQYRRRQAKIPRE